MIKETLLPVRSLNLLRPKNLGHRVLQRLHPRLEIDALIIKSDKGVEMVGHKHVPPDPRSTIESVFREFYKSVVNL